MLAVHLSYIAYETNGLRISKWIANYLLRVFARGAGQHDMLLSRLSVLLNLQGSLLRKLYALGFSNRAFTSVLI